MICTPDEAPIKPFFKFIIITFQAKRLFLGLVSFMCMELPSKIPCVHQISTCDIPLPYFPQTPTVAQWHQPNFNLPKVIRAHSVEQLKTVQKGNISQAPAKMITSISAKWWKGFMTPEIFAKSCNSTAKTLINCNLSTIFEKLLCKMQKIRKPVQSRTEYLVSHNDFIYKLRSP